MTVIKIEEINNKNEQETNTIKTDRQPSPRPI